MKDNRFTINRFFLFLFSLGITLLIGLIFLIATDLGGKSDSYYPLIFTIGSLFIIWQFIAIFKFVKPKIAGYGFLALLLGCIVTIFICQYKKDHIETDDKQVSLHGLGIPVKPGLKRTNDNEL